jgi:hypothetical protein
MGSVIHFLWVSEMYVLLLVADVLVFIERYCIELQVAIELDPGIEFV